MRQILPGVYHWTTFHEGIQEDVHSCYLNAVSPPVLIDPRVPGQGLEWFAKHGAPEHSYLTNRHHYRHSGRFADVFGTRVWCHEAGLHEFVRGEAVTPFQHGDRLPGNILALEVGALCPEETAFQIPVSDGIMAVGDAIIRDERGRLGFVPDFLMGEDPEEVKLGLQKACGVNSTTCFLPMVAPSWGAPGKNSEASSTGWTDNEVGPGSPAVPTYQATPSRAVDCWA